MVSNRLINLCGWKGGGGSNLPQPGVGLKDCDADIVVNPVLYLRLFLPLPLEYRVSILPSYVRWIQVCRIGRWLGLVRCWWSPPISDSESS